MNLSNHFTLEELTHSEVAVRKGLDNTPGSEALTNLADLASALEEVRSLLDCPIIISSGYRSPKVNAAVGGSATSAHCDGYAVDFIVPGFGTPQEIARAIAASSVAFDQLIYEGTWVHLSIDPRMRNNTLTAHFANGKTTYTNGIG